MIISLGNNCTPARQLKRLGLRSAAFPFDSTLTTHAMLLQMLRTDFAGVMDGEVQLVCQRTGFTWFHQQTSEFHPEVLDRLRRRIQRFRDLRSTPRITFIRYTSDRCLEPEADLLIRHGELMSALGGFGFRGFRLVSATPGVAIPHPDFVPMLGPLDSRQPWLGNDADWDQLARKLGEAT